MSVLQGCFTMPDLPRVTTLEPSQPFLPALARYLIDWLAPRGPLALADAVVLLPTRRAARALAEAFVAVAPETATLLPRIRTLGDGDPGDLAGSGLLLGGEADSLAGLPVMDPLARRLTLARLVRARDEAADWSQDPVAALGAAGALASLMDDAQLAQAGDGPAPWARLAQLVQDRDLAAHWDKSVQFLQIVTEVWPGLLAAVGLADPVEARRRGLLRLAQHWRTHPPRHPVILAGSTGAIPVVRELMATVAGLPEGLVVLPGLDCEMDGARWTLTGAEPQHPQHALHAALARLAVERTAVPLLAASPSEPAGPALTMRRRLLETALTPTDATADWLDQIQALVADGGPQVLAEALEGLSLLAAANEDEEASAIALILREALEHPDHTCALVTPDPGIAQRVAAKLRRWAVQVDVSAGEPLSRTPLGALILLALHWMADPAEPRALLALLAHPLCGLGLDETTRRAGTDGLERVLLRQSRKDGDLAGLMARIDASEHRAWTLARADRAAAVRLVAALQAVGLPGDREATLSDMARTAAELVEALAATDTAPGTAVWTGEAGEAAAALLRALQEHGEKLGPLTTHDARRCLEKLMAEVAVRPSGSHPRLSILGPLEARLQSFDTVILGGLDEGLWPAPPPADPFLSAAMRSELGLTSREEAIGVSAHDFLQLAAQRRVILTRSARRGDSPAVPSRWLWRLETLLKAAGDPSLIERFHSGHPALAWVRALEPERTFNPGHARPAPRPPVAARPATFSATQIETWIRDPYKLYARKVLELEALDPIGGDPGSAERGTALHAAFEIAADWVPDVPEDAEAQLRLRLREELARGGFLDQALDAEMVRMEPTIRWLVGWERQRRRDGLTPLVERWVRAEWETKAGPVKLKAKVDRIDLGPDERLEVLDFKTGTIPSTKQVASMISPQLPVTAAIIASQPQEAPIPQRAATDFSYVHAGGRRPRQAPAINPAQSDPFALSDKARATVVKLYEQFAEQERPYLSKPRVQFIGPAARYAQPYDQLARRGEWSNVQEASDD